MTTGIIASEKGRRAADAAVTSKGCPILAHCRLQGLYIPTYLLQLADLSIPQLVRVPFTFERTVVKVIKLLLWTTGLVETVLTC